MILFLYGKDTFRLARRRAFFKDKFRRKYPEGELLTIDAEESREGIVRRVTEFLEPGLFGAFKLLSLEGAETISDDNRKALSEIFSEHTNTKDCVVLVSHRGIPKTKDVLVTFLEQHSKKLEEFGKLSPAEARKFIREEAFAVSAKTSFSREAEEMLLRDADGESAKLSSEARKLASLCPDSVVMPEDVRALCASDPKESVFRALDALSVDDRGTALSMLLSEAARSGTTMPVFGMLAWQLREFFKVRGEYDRGCRNADDIARTIGSKPFTTRKILSNIGRFPISRLKRIIALLSEYDERIKAGRMGGETALSLFVEKF